MAYINGKEIIFPAQITQTTVNVDVVQTTGDSETSVMSQKAVTEELEALRTDIEDKATTEELKEVDTALETLSRGVYGNIKFNIVLNEYVAVNTGDIAPYTGWNRTEHIDCSNLSKLNFAYNYTGSKASNAFYDASGAFIKSFYLASSVAVPENAATFILSANADDLSTVKIICGDSIPDKVKSLEVEAKVLNRTLYGEIALIENSIMNLSGYVTTAETYANWWATDFVFCAGMQSVEYEAVTESTFCANIAFFDIGKKFISGQASGTSMEIPENAYYVRFCGHINSKNAFYAKFNSQKSVIERLYEAGKNAGAGTPIYAGTDANDLRTVGDYLCYSGVINTPTQAIYGISVREYKAIGGTKFIRQTATNYSNGNIYTRISFNDGFTDWVDLVNDHSKPLDGKTIVLFGDSITVLGNIIANKIAETSGATVINCGFSGCRMAKHLSDPYAHYSMFALVNAISANDFTEQESNLASTGGQQTYYANTVNVLKTVDFSAVDFISIAYGTNDWNANVPLKNDENEFDGDTFEGSLRYALKELYTKKPSLRINVCTPLYRFVWSNGVVTNDSDEMVNTLGLKLSDYIASIEKVCGEFHTQVVDLYSEIGFNEYTASAYYPSDDGVHPNIAGRELVGKKIATEIMRNNGIVKTN